MGEHIDVELRSGGSVHMDIDANLLSLNIEDFEFVKGIYSLLTDYADLKVLRVERPKSAGGGCRRTQEGREGCQGRGRQDRLGSRGGRVGRRPRLGAHVQA